LTTSCFRAARRVDSERAIWFEVCRIRGQQIGWRSHLRRLANKYQIRIGKMKQIKKAIVASAFVSAIMASSGSAIAANPTPIEQAEIAQLSPVLQAEVKTRMANSGQKVSEILDTMLLNSVSKIFASGRVIAADFNNGVVVTEGTNGQLRWFNFDLSTLVTKP
jgi:hypothetical protein